MIVACNHTEVVETHWHSGIFKCTFCGQEFDFPPQSEFEVFDERVMKLFDEQADEHFCKL